MKNYNLYMDKQKISAEAHEKLLNLEAPKKYPGRIWAKYGALAACTALILGVGVWKLAPAPAPTGGQNDNLFAADQTPNTEFEQQGMDPQGASQLPLDRVNAGVEKGTDAADFHGFVADSGEDLDKMMLPAIPAVVYPDTTNAPHIAASIALPDGSFSVDLSQQDIELLLWGSEEQMEQAHFKEKPGNVPWLLFWDGFTLSGRAVYDGQGKLWQVYLGGYREDEKFEITMAPGRLPPVCVVQEGSKVTDVRGIAVEGWSSCYDSDGDGVKEYHWESAFIAHNIGVRTTFISPTDESGLSNLFINWNTYEDGGLTLDHLLTNENIPSWREERFDTLAQARQETDFAPYLPEKAPVSGTFYGSLSYQEGVRNMLFVRWSQGYDDVEVRVYRDGCYPYNLVDPDRTEAYDLRLYSIPWSESVPEEYRETVNRPAFRAEDMSLDIVEARGQEKDTGGLHFNFDVLHPDGTLVHYDCSGMTAQQVWDLVEGTL